MILHHARAALVLPFIVSGTFSCMWGSGPTDLDRPALALEELRVAHGDYTDACAQWTSRDDAGTMPTRHVDDVYLLTDDMIGACDDLMRSGRIGQDDRDRVAEMRGRLRDAVDAHRTRFDDVDADDVDAMHDECDGHHREMADLLDETEDRLRSGGMMSGVGGGMM